MRTCEYCHSELSDEATFCGSCGYIRNTKEPSSSSSSFSTRSEDFKTSLLSSSLDIAEPPFSDQPTSISTAGQNSDPLAEPNTKNRPQNTPPAFSGIPVEDIPTIVGDPKPLEETEDEEEKRRRMAFFNRIAPLAAGTAAAGAAAFEMQNMSGQAPMLQGSPDPGSASLLSGTPQDMQPQQFSPPAHSPNQYVAGNTFAQNAPAGQYTPPQQYFSPVDAPSAPSFPPAHPPGLPVSGPGSFGMTPPPFPTSQNPQPKPGGLPKGCTLWGAILLVPTLILLSLLGLSVTVYAPTIILNGSASVSSGDILHVRGHGFFANTTVLLTIDDARPVRFASLAPTPAIVQQSLLMQNQTLLLALTPSLSASNSLKAGANGIFNADIVVDTSWLPGRHQVHAQESFGLRSATVAFTILGQSDTLTTTSTPTPMSTPPTPIPGKMPTPTSSTASAIPTPTTPGIVPTPIPTPVATILPTPTPAPVVISQLTSLTPTTLSLGTLTQNSTQTLTGQTMLNATGNALVAWTATWNQQQATWLQVSPSSGQISTPGNQQIAVTANAGTLQPGNYSTIISFSSPFNTQPLTLTVSFTVQGTCLRGGPSRLAFTGTVGGTDPTTQTVNITNCGAAGPWNATISTTDLANWLSVNPGNGNLATNTSQTVTVSTTLANLAAGTYNGMVTFTNGTNQFQVAVTLTVQAVVIQSPPTIQASKTAFNLTTDCSALPIITIRTTNTSTYTCSLTLTSINTQLPLIWTAAATGRVILSPATGTIASATPLTVTVSIDSVCPGTSDTVTFTGPNNSVTVTFSC